MFLRHCWGVPFREVFEGLRLLLIKSITAEYELEDSNPKDVIWNILSRLLFDMVPSLKFIYGEKLRHLGKNMQILSIYDFMLIKEHFITENYKMGLIIDARQELYFAQICSYYILLLFTSTLVKGF